MAYAEGTRDREDAIDTIIAEAIGEGEEGMRAVAHVMRNRLNQNFRGADTLGDVVRDRKQFTGYSNPGFGVKTAQKNAATRSVAARVLDRVFSGTDPDPTGGANHYLNPKQATSSWQNSPQMKRTTTIGRHQFYTDGRSTPDVPTPQARPRETLVADMPSPPQTPQWFNDRFRDQMPTAVADTPTPTPNYRPVQTEAITGTAHSNRGQEQRFAPMPSAPSSIPTVSNPFDLLPDGAWDIPTADYGPAAPKQDRQPVMGRDRLPPNPRFPAQTTVNGLDEYIETVRREQERLQAGVNNPAYRDSSNLAAIWTSPPPANLPSSTAVADSPSLRAPALPPLPSGSDAGPDRISTRERWGLQPASTSDITPLSDYDYGRPTPAGFQRSMSAASQSLVPRSTPIPTVNRPAGSIPTVKAPPPPAYGQPGATPAGGYDIMDIWGEPVTPTLANGMVPPLPQARPQLPQQLVQQLPQLIQQIPQVPVPRARPQQQAAPRPAPPPPSPSMQALAAAGASNISRGTQMDTGTSSGGSQYGYATGSDNSGRQVTAYTDETGRTHTMTMDGDRITYNGGSGGTRSDGSSRDSGTVLCTYFMEKGWLSYRLWKADTDFSATLPRSVRRQYWRWAVPAVRRLREGDERLERLLWPIVKAWAHYAGWRMGVVKRFPVSGWLIHRGRGLLARLMRRIVTA